jgi:hypothetical protein
MTAHHIPTSNTVGSKSPSEVLTAFLQRNQETLVQILRLIGEDPAAERVAALTTRCAIQGARMRQAVADLEYAEECLAEAPVSLEHVSSPGWSDLDAALRWMGARLSDFNIQMSRSSGR